MTARHPVAVPIAVVLVAALLAGCVDEPVEAPVAARVNDAGIPVQQVQAVLKRQPKLLDDQPDTATGRVLDVLVDQELAAQAATEQGLDQDPEIAQALALARREVLARAWQERQASAAATAGRDEIDQFREAHPLLFAQRRLYAVQEFSVEATPAQAEELAAIALRARTADEVGALLREAGYAHRTQRYADAAEDLPAALLQPLAALQAGQSVALASGGVPRIVTLLGTHAAPIEPQRADEAIAAHLAAEHRRFVVASAMKALRDAAQISYRGGFARAPVVAPRFPPAAPG